MNSYIFVNGVEIYQFKAKYFKINAASLCLGNVSKDFSIDNIKYGYLWFLDIHKYLMKKTK